MKGTPAPALRTGAIERSGRAVPRRSNTGEGSQLPTTSSTRPGGSFEDAVVRHERDAKSERRGGNPAIGVVVTLAQRVPDPFARDPQLDVGPHEITAGVDDLGASNLGIQAVQAGAAPSAEEGAIAELGDGLERKEGRTADKEGLIAMRKR